MVAPDPLVVSEKVRPVPLPPEAVKVFDPRGATDAVAGLMLIPAPTLIVAVAILPSESVAVTTSVVLAVGPAVYAPEVELTEPPEPLTVSEKVRPVPLPPEAMKVFDPRGATEAAVGLMLTPAPTVTLAVATLPVPSLTLTTSVTLGVGPAT